MKIKILKKDFYKKRDKNIELIAKGYFQPKTVKSKKIYTRKIKHKKKFLEY